MKITMISILEKDRAPSRNVFYKGLEMGLDVKIDLSTLPAVATEEGKVMKAELADVVVRTAERHTLVSVGRLPSLSVEITRWA